MSNRIAFPSSSYQLLDPDESAEATRQGDYLSAHGLSGMPTPTDLSKRCRLTAVASLCLHRRNTVMFFALLMVAFALLAGRRKHDHDKELHNVQADHEVRLTEYRLSVDIVKQIFNEFWAGNAFFLSFFSAITVGLIANADRLRSASLAIIIAVIVVVCVISFIWLITNIKHDYYITLHIGYAAELEEKYLGAAIYKTRRKPKSGLPSISIKRVWIVTPVIFAALDVIILVITKAGL